jgi:hypothetical protein
MFCDLFPGKILPWTIYGSKKAWKEDPKKTGSSAIKWLFDDYLKIPKDQIPEYATCRLFWRVGFSGIMTNRRIGYNSSPYLAVDSAYPFMFLRSDFDKRRKISKINTKQLKKSIKN